MTNITGCFFFILLWNINKIIWIKQRLITREADYSGHQKITIFFSENKVRLPNFHKKEGCHLNWTKQTEENRQKCKKVKHCLLPGNIVYQFSFINLHIKQYKKVNTFKFKIYLNCHYQCEFAKGENWIPTISSLAELQDSGTDGGYGRRVWFHLQLCQSQVCPGRGFIGVQVLLSPCCQPPFLQLIFKFCKTFYNL